jgi:8-amino-7-oxononanoate synthase
MISRKTQFLVEELDRLEVLHQRRFLKRLGVQGGCRVLFKGRQLINFSSNDYLGLSQDPRVKEAAKAAIDHYPASATSSRLICGNFDVHEQLEEELAAFKGRASALVFSSGYMTNVGLLSALCGEKDWVYSDALNHASIIDGCRLSRARVQIFRHKDMDHLETLLKGSPPSARKVLVTDSVFSMEGDLADLPGLVSLAGKYGCLLVLDEAHGTGVLGAQGCGLAEHFADQRNLTLPKGTVDIEMGTLSKALGSFGGFVACDGLMKDYLMNKSRSFIFSTSLPPSAVGAARASLNIVRQEPALRRQLWANVELLKNRLQAKGFDLQSSESPILPIHFGSEEKALRISESLVEKGFFVPAIRPPSVPQGTSRLRLTVTAAHSEAEIEDLVEGLVQVANQA